MTKFTVQVLIYSGEGEDMEGPIVSAGQKVIEANTLGEAVDEAAKWVPS